jgi:tetratricopeptide (TPR) repeat protein
MQIKKAQIEEAIKGKGDFVKIDYLKRYLQKADNIEAKKFILLSLADICESRNILNEAVKNVTQATEISITNREKLDLFMRESELYLKMRNFDMAEKALKKAFSISLGNQQRMELSQIYLEMFRNLAIRAEQEGKLRHALEYYEKLYHMKQSEPKKIEAREKLADLYSKLGMEREYRQIQKDF